MIKYVVIALFSIGALQAQQNNTTASNDIAVGDVLQIGEPVVSQYKHIDFPRANFIIKSGGIADFKTVKGNHVVVTAISENAKGETKVTLKRKDGRKFFRNYATVNADLAGALNDGELRKL